MTSIRPCSSAYSKFSVNKEATKSAIPLWRAFLLICEHLFFPLICDWNGAQNTENENPVHMSLEIIARRANFFLLIFLKILDDRMLSFFCGLQLETHHLLVKLSPLFSRG